MSSSLKKKKNESKYALSKQDIEFYKMTGVFAIACVFVLLALKMQETGVYRISSGYDLTYNFYTFCYTPAFVAIALIALVGSVCWFALSKIKKIDESGRVFSSLNCLAIFAYLAFFTLCFGCRLGSEMHGFFIVATIVAAALYYVSKIFKADFVLYSCVTAILAASIYVFSLYFEPYMIAIKVIVVLACFALTVLFSKRIKGMKISKKKKASFLIFPCYISLAIGTVCLFVRIVPSICIAKTAMLALLLAQYVAFAIVYAIRLIKE